MLKPSSNLYCYDRYFNLLNRIVLNQVRSRTLLINGPESCGKKTFILHFFSTLNMFFEDKKKDKLDIYKSKITDDYLGKVSNNVFLNFKILKKDLKGIISVDEIRELSNFISMPAFNNNPRFIAIFNVENLNNNAANALLKTLENPPSDCYIFLIKNHEKKILDTILSRSLKININFSSFENNNIFEKLLLDFNIDNKDYNSLFSKFDSAGSKILKLKYLEKNNLLNSDIMDIIIFCLKDYSINKNQISFDFFLYFFKIFYYNKFKTDFHHFNKSYVFLIDKIYKIIKFNNDPSYLINRLTKL